MNTLRRREHIPALDTVRGLAVIFMVLVHVLNSYADPAVMGSTFAVVVDFMGGPPAAPVFMILMGMFFKPQHSFRRGSILLAIGYLLNFFKGVAPIYLGTELLNLPMVVPEMYTYTWLFLNVEILVFAGLAYLAMGAIRLVFDRAGEWLAIASVVAVVSPLLWGLGENIPVLGRFLQPLWGADTDLVTFPLFPWLWFPLVGMSIGRYLEMYEDRRILVIRICYTALILFGAGLALTLWNYDFFYYDYGQMGLGGILGITGIALLWSLGVIWISSRLKDRLATGYFAFLSRRVTVFYIIHWLILGWMMLLIQADSLGYGEWALMSAAVLAGSSILTHWFGKMTGRR